MIAPHYTVIWAPEIERRIADYWVRSDSAERNRLTKIVHSIDHELSAAPERTGEMLEREATTRFWVLSEFDPPVRVVFEFSPGDRIVSVLLLTLHGRRVY
ncbi:MAG: type II toxin-antitoxin system RelE/ParE family toxin [Planctomycetaceae bacterium]